MYAFSCTKRSQIVPNEDSRDGGPIWTPRDHARNMYAAQD
jgi:hypothetical protein